jgi:cytochrome c-type biogenesis protein CcmH/NrfF
MLSGTFVFQAPADTPDERRRRVERIENAVLAPCCYKEPVSRHQSEIAVKMRVEIANWVAAGKSDREILDTYAGLYGAKVLIDPRTAPRWWVQWVPWGALLIGCAGGIWLLWRWRSKSAAQS